MTINTEIINMIYKFVLYIVFNEFFASIRKEQDPTGSITFI